ncbi:MAG: class I SAM-dependent methyltransferase [Dehalococcoidales bacterium]
MVIKQDKAIEILVGSGTPEDDWLEDSRGYKVRLSHLELLGLANVCGKKILDAGCGPGTYGIMLATQVNEVTGIEISPAGVEVANRRAAEKGVTFKASQGDLESLPFDDNTFDICFCGWVLHHFPDVNLAVSELMRVLKPGGKIAMAEPNESCAAVKFSRWVEDLPLLRGWVLKEGWDTPNRTINKHYVYLSALEKYGITNIKLDSCYTGGMPPLPPKSQNSLQAFLSLVSIKILVRIRSLIFAIGNKVLQKPFNGSDLLIIGIKEEK